MQTKIRKLIQQIPADNLRPFLENYDLNLPKDFKWKNDHKQYHVELHNCIWNIHEDHKPSLFEAIERIHEMTEEWGQAALCAEIGKDNQFFQFSSIGAAPQDKKPQGKLQPKPGRVYLPDQNCH